MNIIVLNYDLAQSQVPISLSGVTCLNHAIVYYNSIAW